MVEIGCERERETETKDTDTGWRRTGKLTFKTTLWAYIQGLMSLLLWREAFNQGLPGAVCSHLRTLARYRLDCPSDRLTDWLTDCSICGYRCIYNFIMSTLSGYLSGGQSTWSSSVVLFFTLLTHPVLEIRNWSLCQMSIRNNETRTHLGRFANSAC